MKVDILILNYNGKDLLKKHLPSVCKAAESSLTECKVHVVDNLSTDGSVELLKDDFPSVKVHVAQENRVLCSYNEVVRDLDSELVIFLNNDIEVDPDFVDPLADHFRDENVMFVAPKVMNMDNTFNGGRSIMKFDKGIIKVMVDHKKYNAPGSTCAISCGAFRRDLFLDFGGFDELYLPGIWEDVDICFRGISQGWKGLYEPKSVIWHAESTTFNREYGEKKKMAMAHRNMFLFFWKNIRDGGMIVKHIFFLPARLLYSLISGKTEFIHGFFLALKKMPEAFSKRKEEIRK